MIKKIKIYFLKHRQWPNLPYISTAKQTPPLVGSSLAISFFAHIPCPAISNDSKCGPRCANIGVARRAEAFLPIAESRMDLRAIVAVAVVGRSVGRARERVHNGTLKGGRKRRRRKRDAAHRQTVHMGLDTTWQCQLTKTARELS